MHHYGHNYNFTQTVHGTSNRVEHVANASFGPNSVIEQAFVSARDVGWDTLPQQDDFWGKNEYLEESREDVVQDFLRWFKDPTSELTLFIQGAAGLGKSTLARHLTHRLNTEGLLAASVSLSPSVLPSDARSVVGVVKMAAYKIGVIHPTAIPAINKAIKSCHGAPLANHIEMFLIDPIRSLSLHPPLAIIFDAVDEWESYAALIKALSSIRVAPPFPIKFILLGRSDPRGRGFKDHAIRPYLLQPVSTAVMQRFLSKQLEDVLWDHRRGPAQWRITKLAELANGWFIWATIACSLLQKRGRYSSPDRILDSILDARKSLGDGEEMESLYHQAIMLLFPDAERQDLLRKYLTATVALQEPLPTDDFSFFTNLDIRAIGTIQTDLRALQIRRVGPGEAESHTVYPARALFHLSFLEYLESMVTPKTQGDLSFHVARFDSHSQWAECCLMELPRFLLGPHPLDYRALSQRQRYAITYVMTHLHRGTPSVRPDSSSNWRSSRHYTILRLTSIQLFERWGSLFVDLAKPRSSIQERAAEDYSPPPPLSASYRLRPDPEMPMFVNVLPNVRESKEPVEESVDHGNSNDDAHVVEGTDHDDRVAHLLCNVATTSGKHPTLPGFFKAHCLEVAVRLRPDDADIWHRLGGSYWDVAERAGSAEASERAVKAHQHALQTLGPLRAPSPPGAGADNRGRFLNSLATAFHTRFELIGNTGDLEKAIALRSTSLAMPPRSHPDRALSLNNMVGTLSTYLELGRPFTQTIDVNNLIHLQRESLDLLPQGDIHRGLHLHNLSFCLRSRGESTSSLTDLNEVIKLGRAALAGCPVDNADRASALNRLAWDLIWQYEVQGDSQHLEEAVRLGRESLSLCPVGHLNRYRTLDTLATALHFKPDYLDEALQLSQESLSLIPPSHVNRWEILMTLASIHFQRFKGLGSADELEEAISVCEEALAMQPPEHFRRHKLLTLQDKLAEAKSSSSSAV
ncbi:hypothetical protein FA13DRAFT_1818195 [Coprinellus micaceus]|uniref:Nephrocystin 3-like N-terminal domain-containing protein n=1 Tax=Coprinellus micaceus TaxID=71717 RepID=A0A4Y7SPM0_COPMI|nr:hypothetical protein FA13DRAFT_1818195 [Coprinellus micaceus]